MDDDFYKAEKVWEQLDVNNRQLLTKIAAQTHLTPLEYIVRELENIEARRKYCEKEGIDYREFSIKRLQESMSSLQKSLSTLCREAFLKAKKFRFNTQKLLFLRSAMRRLTKKPEKT